MGEVECKQVGTFCFEGKLRERRGRMLDEGEEKLIDKANRTLRNIPTDRQTGVQTV